MLNVDATSLQRLMLSENQMDRGREFPLKSILPPPRQKEEEESFTWRLGFGACVVEVNSLSRLTTQGARDGDAERARHWHAAHLSSQHCPAARLPAARAAREMLKLLNPWCDGGGGEEMEEGHAAPLRRGPQPLRELVLHR